MQTQGRQYLYEVVYKTLKSEILEGIYPHGIILPSEREISIRFDVDRTTVRRALEMLVTERLVEKRAGVGTHVIFKQDNPGFTAMGNDKLVGFFVVENGSFDKKISQPFYSDLFYYVEEHCKRHSANLIYSTIKTLEDLTSMIASLGFSGIIFASKVEDDYVQLVKSRGIKVAQILGYNTHSLIIRYDSAAAGKITIDYLAERGHRNIAFITGPKDFHVTSERMMGVLLAMHNHGIPIKNDQVFEGNWEYESGYECTNKILALCERPTAIYAFNDMMAMGAMQAITDAGLKIPDDISIVSTDNMSKMSSGVQRLTTTDTNIPILASVATDYFFNDALQYTDGTKIIVPISFVEGDTVKDLR